MLIMQQEQIIKKGKCLKNIHPHLEKKIKRKRIIDLYEI